MSIDNNVRAIAAEGLERIRRRRALNGKDMDLELASAEIKMALRPLGEIDHAMRRSIWIEILRSHSAFVH